MRKIVRGIVLAVMLMAITCPAYAVKCDVSGKELGDMDTMLYETYGTSIRVHMDNIQEVEDKLVELRLKHKNKLDVYEKAMKEDIEKWKVDKQLEIQ